ncbi:site-2 protease family protein [Parapedobacter deserti]|uniref:Site-2 protease family protein n=1 Tax=Parapedobacter deserti TaxID=1912957 RepID=A0ABV7JL75_9SPHI
MFGIQDIPKFIMAFFVLLPLISTIHEAGHVFFAWLMGGKNIKITIGTGKPLFNWSIIEVRQYYFWYGVCTFNNIKREKKIANILIFSGGALFNLLGTIAVILLVQHEIINESLFTYQFTYFSLYYIFFALIPTPYPDGSFSDGKIIFDLLRGKEDIIKDRIFRIYRENSTDHWRIFDDKNNLIGSYQDQIKALAMINEIAQSNRPSKVINGKDEDGEEISNYPRIPL